MMRSNELEKIFWSIAFPGFGQILNGKLIKGIVFIALEFVINVQSHMDQVIVYSFHGNIQDAIQFTDYQWLMFYPCVYLSAIWDAYRDSGGGNEPYAFVPFVFAAYIGTIGVLYSPTFTVFGYLLGPVWLGILGFGAGVGVGYIVRYVLTGTRARRQ